MMDPFRGIRGTKVMMNEELSKHTSFHIGGPAQYLVYVLTKKALCGVLGVIRKKKMRFFLIGAGTNLLAMDAGFDGVILKLGGVFKKMSLRNGQCRCGGGLLIDKFLRGVAEKGYGGAEFMAGIPGTLGGAVKGNAGAFGRSISDLIESVVVMDRYGVERIMLRAELGFSYRNSRVKESDIITSVDLVLKKQKRRVILDRINKNLRIRERKHPKGYSAGSFFKNPPGRPAGQLIDECGLKGMSVGDAEISRKHGNYIINRGQAMASDVMALSTAVRKAVREKTGVTLKQEVKVLK
jgi:UDP-N-acetylmuramate dehydrogenase